MYFVFKISFLLHRVTNHNFKKAQNFISQTIVTNTVKIESKKSLKGCVSEEKCDINSFTF